MSERTEGDCERIDWLERNYASLHCNYVHPDDWTVTTYFADGSDREFFFGDTIRQAIDKARGQNE